MLGYQPYIESDALVARHPYEGPLHPPLTPTTVTLAFEARSLERLVTQITSELDAIRLLIERCSSPEQRERLLELAVLDKVSEILNQSPLNISLVSESSKLLASLARDFHARQKISDQLMSSLTRVLVLTKNEEISDLFFVMSLCPHTAVKLVPILSSVRLVLSSQEISRSSALLCACAARVVDAQPATAEIFVGRKFLSEISHLDFLAAVARASAGARLELLSESAVVEISAHKLGNFPEISALCLLEALAIEAEGKISVARHATGVLTHLAICTEIPGNFRSTLHRLIRSVAELPRFLENFVEICQGEGPLLREIFGNLALKPLCNLLPSALALNSFHEILTQPGNPVMLAHFVCPRTAWRSPREFAIAECVSVREKLRACEDRDLADQCLQILM